MYIYIYIYKSANDVLHVAADVPKNKGDIYIMLYVYI